MKLLKTRLYGFGEIIGNGGEITASCHSLVLYLLLSILSFNILSGYFCFTQFGDISHSLNFDKFRDTAPLSSPILNKCISPTGARVGDVSYK